MNSDSPVGITLCLRLTDTDKVTTVIISQAI